MKFKPVLFKAQPEQGKWDYKMTTSLALQATTGNPGEAHEGAGPYLRGKRRKKGWSQWEWTKNKLYLLHHFASQSLLNKWAKLKKPGSLVSSYVSHFWLLRLFHGTPISWFEGSLFTSHSRHQWSLFLFFRCPHTELIHPFSAPPSKPLAYLG